MTETRDRVQASPKEIQTTSKMVIDFLLNKRDLHFEVYKGLENRAIQLLLFNGVTLSLLINIIHYFPNLNSMIYIESIGFSYNFLIVNTNFYLLSTFCSIYVIINSLFLDTFTEKGFLKEINEMDIELFTYDYNNTILNNRLFLNIHNELHEELKVIRKKNKTNSIMISAAIVFNAIGIGFMILTLLTIAE
ncbi:MAG: hypothetical protein ACFFCD_17265 [Promethearchaeota archaeon]